MIICIAGLTGVGKNAVGEIVASKLGYRLVCPTFKDLASREGISLLEFQKKAASDHGIDKKFDVELRRGVQGGNCIVTTWLGPWMIKKADLRVKLVATDDVRAKRISEREKITLGQAMAHIKERDSQNQKRYMDVYGINITEESVFDMVMDTSKISQQEAAEKILRRAKRG
jgi:cytidylate kinase